MILFSKLYIGTDSIEFKHSKIHTHLDLLEAQSIFSLIGIYAYNKMIEQKDDKSNNKNSNPKIGRPAKTDQQQQFKNHYLNNRRKFQLQCELLVYIHHIFHEEIPTHPSNQRVSVGEMLRLFEAYDCMYVYYTLAKLNENYFKSSSMFPQQKLKYTSLIDVSYMMRQLRIDHGNKISSYALVFLVFFFLFNEKVINNSFYEYFKQRIEKFRAGMINGPGKHGFNKMDTLVVALGLEVAIREGMMIEDEVYEEIETQEQSKQKQNKMDLQNQPRQFMHSQQEQAVNVLPLKQQESPALDSQQNQ